MEIETLTIDGKTGQTYYSHCPNCRKFLVPIKKDTITCPNCKKKYIVQYPEE